MGPGAPDQIPSVPADGVKAPVIKPTLDAPLVPLLAVGDYVWVDIGRNGVQDAGEAPVPNVTVAVQTPSGVTIATTTTDAAGHYVFDGLLSGSYQVVFAGIPAGFVFTSSLMGDATADSNPTSAGVTAVFALVPGDSAVRNAVPADGVTLALLINPTIDAGIVPNVFAIGDYVFLDDNLNGIQDPGELPVPGVTVELLNPDGTAATHSDGRPVLPVVTDANGHYVFDNQLPGDYQVVFSDIPAGYEPTVPQAPGSTPDNDSDGSGMGQTPVIPIGPGQPGTRPVAPGDSDLGGGELIAGQIDSTIDLGIANSAAVEAARNGNKPGTAPPVLPAGPGKGMPNTGFDLASNLSLGFGLLLLGCWMELVTRRRSRVPASSAENRVQPWTRRTADIRGQGCSGNRESRLHSTSEQFLDFARPTSRSGARRLHLPQWPQP